MGTVTSLFDLKTIYNTLAIYYYDEYRIVISNNKWTLLVRRNFLAFLHLFNGNNKLILTLINITISDFYRIISFRAQLETYVSLSKYPIPRKKNISEIILDKKRVK